MARKLVSTEISRLFQVVNYVARYSLLGLREGVEAIGQKVGYSLGLGVAHPTSMFDTGLHHSHNTTRVANLLPRASTRTCGPEPTTLLAFSRALLSSPLP